VPSWYPVVRAVRYYRGAYTIQELLRLPVCITQWALTAEYAEAEGERIAYEIYKQRADLKG
jgi:hypothetical protein